MSTFEKWPEQPDVVTSDFVLDDRRTLGLGEVEHDVAMAYSAAAWNVDAGRPRLQVEKLVGTRGERLVAAQVDTVYEDGSESSALMVWRLGPNLRDLNLCVMFDLDDVDAATAELDRLQAEIESDSN